MVRFGDPRDFSYVRCFALGVPAVTGVVGHLVAHVLAEAEPGWIHADLDQEEVDASHEVTQHPVGDDALQSEHRFGFINPIITTGDFMEHGNL